MNYGRAMVAMGITIDKGCFKKTECTSGVNSIGSGEHQGLGNLFNGSRRGRTRSRTYSFTAKAQTGGRTSSQGRQTTQNVRLSREGTVQTMARTNRSPKAHQRKHSAIFNLKQKAF